MNKPLHIAIDASRATIERVTGTEYYARKLIEHLILHNEMLDTPHNLSLFFRDEPAQDLFPSSDHVQYHVIPFPRMWTHVRFAASIWLQQPDVTFVPAHTLPLNFLGKAVVTVHDLGYKVFPQAHPESQRNYLDWSTKHSANRATRILADSQATADDLQHFYNISQDKIRVVYPGVERPPDGEILNLFNKYNLPSRYFLFIGTLQPRKNIERIVQAFDMWQNANPKHSYGLVLAGKKGWLYDEAWVKGVKNVHVPGYIDDEDKGILIQQAVALVFPTLYEGFGFPVVESMLWQTPVIASKTSSLPELVGDAGILVNPEEVNEIAAAMDMITQHNLLRRKLIVKGMLQAQQFTWERAAEQTMQVLIEAAHA